MILVIKILLIRQEEEIVQILNWPSLRVPNSTEVSSKKRIPNQRGIASKHGANNNKLSKACY
jgi:hypothetical protein